jgi:hypothetical protein
MNINGRLTRLEKQTIPTMEDLDPILLSVLPDDIRAACVRFIQCQDKPGDFEKYEGWVRENYPKIHAAFDRVYPRWRDNPQWAEIKAEIRAANEQV